MNDWPIGNYFHQGASTLNNHNQQYQVEDRCCTHDIRCRHPLKNPTLSKVVNRNFYGMKERFMKSSASDNYIIMGRRQNPWF